MAVSNEINIQGSSINQKPNSTVSVMPFKGATFVKKKSWLVARIVSSDFIGLHLLTFCIYYLLSAMSKDLSHVISH